MLAPRNTPHTIARAHNAHAARPRSPGCSPPARSRSARCGDTLQDRPIAHNTLESLIVAPYPVYWLGRSFQGLQITDASHDPGGAFSVQYGDCVVGGQSTCVTPAAASSPRPTTASSPAAARSRSTAVLRGVQAVLAERGRTVAIATGGVVVDVYADSARLAAAAAQTIVPINDARRTRRAAAHAAARHRLRLDAATLAGALAAARAALRRALGGGPGASARWARPRPRGSGRTAIVIRVIAHARPASSVKRTSHTHVVRPRCKRVACACTVPSVTGRRKLVLLDRPIAMLPSGITASAVAIEAIDSAIDAYTPPCTSPAGCLSSSRTTTCAVTCRSS